MSDMKYIEDQFREMTSLGYSCSETIASLQNDTNVDEELLKEFLKGAD